MVWILPFPGLYYINKVNFNLLFVTFNLSIKKEFIRLKYLLLNVDFNILIKTILYHLIFNGHNVVNYIFVPHFIIKLIPFFIISDPPLEAIVSTSPTYSLIETYSY